MTRDVEERIVAMYFDNEDFEKKAKTTIETLGQLQKGMNLEESAKGFDVFEKIGKTLNFDKAQKGLSKIKSTMNGMGSIFKKVFNLGPIDEAAAAVENFKNRYLNRVLGFDLAHTVANALEGAFRQLTIQPISAGWTQYENKMDSVKTIMSSTGQSIGVVQKHLEDLTTYANKTIYSLSDMTSNLGKFTNNGMKLEDSVSAMKGIANAAADAGQGAQQASMAMYNFSQAMGVGKMTTIDWKSIENANMATTRLKETFMEMAAANGTLQKEFDETTKKYHYYVTKNSKGQTEKDKKKWTEVTAKNFRETLSKDWLTSDAMMHALQIYSGDLIDANTFKSWGITDPEQIKALEKIGKDAYEAATQVRTFTKMMDALREAAQSGWADTFELIFGDMEQGTTLWTTINDVIDPILSKSAKARNDMLQIWAGTNIDTKNEEQELADKTAELDALNKKLEELQKTGKNKGEIEKTISDINTLKGEIGALYKVIAEKKNTPKSIFLDEQGRTGREILFDKETGALFRLIELAQKLGGAFSEAFKSVFGEMNAEKLFNLTKQIGDGVENMFKWFTEKDSGKETSRLEKITTGLKGVFSIVKTVVNFLKMGFNLLKRLVAPVADFLINAFEKFGEFFNGLGELNPVEVFQKLGEGLQKTWEKVKKFFTPQEILDKNGKATGKSEIPVITWLKNTWTQLKETIKTWAFDNGLGEVWTSVSNWWTEFSGAINSGYEQLKSWWEGSGIPAFFTRMWNEITKLFTPKLAGVTYDGTGRHEQYADSPVVAFFKGIWTGMQSAFDELQNWWNGSGIPAFFTRMWNEITKLFTPKLAGVTYDGTGRHEQYADSPVVAFFKGIWTGIDNAFKGLSNWWNNESGIPEFFQGMWDEVNSWFAPTVIEGKQGNTWTKDPPIVEWLTGVWNSVKGVWDSIVGWEGWGALGEFLSNTWTWIVGLFSGSEESVAGASEAAIEASKNTTATPAQTEESLDFFGRIMEVIGDFIKKIVETVNGAVIPEGISTFLKGAGDFITGAFKVIGDILGSFGKWFNNGWNSDEMTSEDKWNIILSIVGIIGTVVTQLFAAKWMSQITGMSSIGTQFLEFAGGLLLIAGAVSLLTTIDSSKMQAGAKILAGLALAIGVVLFAVGQIKSATTSTPTTGTERFFTNLINKLALLGALGIITSALPGIIKAVSEAKALGVENLGEDILKITEGMSLLFSSVGLTLGVIMSINPAGIDPTAAMKTVLALSGSVYALYAVINFMGGLPELIGDKGAKATLANLDRGGAILEKLGIAIGGFFGAMIGAFTGGVSEGAVVAAANGLSQTTDVLSEISTEDINKFSIMLDFVAQLLEGFGSSTALDIFDRIATGGKLKTLGDQLPALATGIDSIMSKVKTYTDEDVNRFRECVRFINYFANAMSLVAAATSGKTGFWVYDVDQAVFQEYMEAAEQLSEAVKKGLMNEDGSMTGLEFNAMPIIDAICHALEGGEYAISTAVKKMVNAGLKRVDTDGASGASRLTVPDEVITFYQQFSGKFKTENGSTFDLNEAISQFMGDDSEFAKLMDLFDAKTSDLEQKWGEFTNVFDNFDLLKIKKLNAETGEEEEVSAVSFMQEQLDALSAAVKESGGLEVTITPVFSMDNMTRDKLQGALDAELGTTPLSANATFDNPTVTIDFKTLSSELDMAGIHNKLQSMLYQMAAADSNNQAAINRLGNDISDLADAVSDMKLVLDTGVLVGQITPQIDVALGQRSAKFSRTGVVYVNP